MENEEKLRDDVQNLFDALEVTKEDMILAASKIGEALNEGMESLPEHLKTNGVRDFSLLTLIYNTIAETPQLTFKQRLDTLRDLRTMIEVSEDAAMARIVNQQVASAGFSMDKVLTQLFLEDDDPEA